MSSKKEQQADWKKKTQHQIWVANEGPDPSFDLTDCGLYEVPANTYSTCKVCSKEGLLLGQNFLKSLTGEGNSLHLLVNLKVLDLHDNQLEKLPSDIELLKSLQVLNISNNRLKKLPSELTSLRALQSFNCADNIISKLPDRMRNLTSLRTLNLSKNLVTKLPTELAYCRALESLAIDLPKMKYPDKVTCEEGLPAIMRRLCSDAGIEYVPPSKAVLPLLKNNGSTNKADVEGYDMDGLQSSMMRYEQMKKIKQQELLSREAAMLDNEAQIQELDKRQKARKIDQIHLVSKELEDFDANMDMLQSRQDQTRMAMIAAILQDDERCTEQINDIIKRNTDGTKNQDLIQDMEDERMRELAQIAVKQEELMAVKREDMLRHMKEALVEMQAVDRNMSANLLRKQQNIDSVQQRAIEEQKNLESKIASMNAERGETIDQLLSEEQWQRTVLESMMRERDEKHCQLTKDIMALEEQLAKLSFIEMNNRHKRNQDQNVALEEQRQQLAELLYALMDQRDRRAKQIAQRLVEMELAREEEDADFWLAQLQRLIDRKPDALIKREGQLDQAVIDILIMAEADDYRPWFARQRVSLAYLRAADDKAVREVGVTEAAVRQAILDATQRYIEKNDLYKTDESKLSEQSDVTKLSAPSISRESSYNDSGAAAAAGTSSVTSTISKPSSTRTHVTQECVICMEKQTNIVFLPCGHVCTCLDCSQPLIDCPMCRARIEHKIILDVPF